MSIPAWRFNDDPSFTQPPVVEALAQTAYAPQLEAELTAPVVIDAVTPDVLSLVSIATDTEASPAEGLKPTNELSSYGVKRTWAVTMIMASLAIKPIAGIRRLKPPKN